MREVTIQNLETKEIKTLKSIRDTGRFLGVADVTVADRLKSPVHLRRPIHGWAVISGSEEGSIDHSIDIMKATKKQMVIGAIGKIFEYAYTYNVNHYAESRIAVKLYSDRIEVVKYRTLGKEGIMDDADLSTDLDTTLNNLRKLYNWEKKGIGNDSAAIFN